MHYYAISVWFVCWIPQTPWLLGDYGGYFHWLIFYSLPRLEESYTAFIVSSYWKKWRLSSESPQYFVKKNRGLSRATEKKWRTLDNTRSILWKMVRGVSWATEKKWRTLDNTRSILWKRVRGVWRATEKKWRTLDNTRSIFWKKVRGYVTSIDPYQKFHETELRSVGVCTCGPMWNAAAVLRQRHGDQWVIGQCDPFGSEGVVLF